MSQTFAELGLRPELVAAAGQCGFEDPTTLQRAAIPVIRRGGNVVLRASSGAGVTAAYGLAVLDRLADGATTEVRAVAVVPSMDRASAVATALALMAEGTAMSVRALAPGWSATAANVVVATAQAVLRGVRDSSLKLESVETVVLDGLSILVSIDGVENIETLLGAMPTAAQRVMVTGESTREVDRLIQAHARRAIEIPPRPADPALAPPVSPRGELSYTVVATSRKDDVLLDLMARRANERTVVSTRTAAHAAKLRDLLQLRGLAVLPEETSAQAGASIVGALDAARITIAYDVPADARVLERVEPGGLVLVTARELPHLRAIAREAGFELRAVTARREHGGLEPYRQRIRQALGEEDIDAQLLVLDPLFEEHSATEVAAALSAMLRARRTPAEVAAPSAPAQEEARPAAFVRIFVSIGQRDGIRPADVVGAFTGEAGIKGEQIGRIEIRESFSVVEVDSTVAERVIRALNGTTMRGRSIRVDFDRKTSTPQRKGRASRA